MKFIKLYYKHTLQIYWIPKLKNFDALYWKYLAFNLDNLSDDECISELRFYRNDIYRLLDILQPPPETKLYTGLVFVSVVKTFRLPISLLGYGPLFWSNHI